MGINTAKFVARSVDSKSAGFVAPISVFGGQTVRFRAPSFAPSNCNIRTGVLVISVEADAVPPSAATSEKATYPRPR